ncbi:MAG: TPM domain-containing protein [Polaromonas sp.]|nr:TPM domain-containing protein [Polaromonas sp.]
MAAQLTTFLKHLWLDADDASRMITPPVIKGLTERVAASERHHSGQIRLCIEASLPLSYLWRVGHGCSLQQVVRERAVMMFGKLGVWDTAHNNGVLIYVLVAEHAIEIVADRGISAHISSTQWTELVSHMSQDFRAGSYEAGLSRAIDHVSSELLRHFPRLPAGGLSGDRLNTNELPDAPVLL